MGPESNASWEYLEDLMEPSRDDSNLTGLYKRYIEDEIRKREEASASRTASGVGGGHLAAAILEPLLQGAGGMLLIDPQFQRAMVQVGASSMCMRLYGEQKRL